MKTFVGTSANALHIQIWTALIALLLLKYLQLKAPLRLVALESGRPAPDEPVRVSRPVGLARRPVQVRRRRPRLSKARWRSANSDSIERCRL